jgi:hypothetical protein
MIGSKSITILAVLVAAGAASLYAKSAQAVESVPGDQSLIEQQETPSDAGPGSDEYDHPPKSPLRLSTVDYQDTADGSGKLVLAGIALPGKDLYLFFDDQPLAQLHPDDAGNWSFEKEMKLDDDRHTFRADQYDQDSQMVAARATVQIQRAPAVPPAPKAATP